MKTVEKRWKRLGYSHWSIAAVAPSDGFSVGACIIGNTPGVHIGLLLCLGKICLYFCFLKKSE